MGDRLEKLCIEKGLKMTEQRRVIARVLSESTDHPDVEMVYQRATERDPRISIATVYRTVKLFEEASILERHDFGDGRARYEERPEEHHDHLIDVKTGEVIEFSNEEIERLHRQLAASRQVGAHDEAAELEERLAVLTARRDASLRGGAP
jgi:Fur family ferric uptake transcriptional regulator